MIDLTKLLNVSEDQVFYINEGRFKILNNALYRPRPIKESEFEEGLSPDGQWIQSKMTVNHLIEATITKPPFVPKIGEACLKPAIAANGRIGWAHSTFQDDAFYYILLEAGLIYREDEEELAREKGTAMLITLIDKWKQKVQE